MAVTIDKETKLYEKEFPILENSKKNRNNELANSADKANKVAKETSKVTTTATWKQIPDTQELKTENDELKSHNEELNAKIKELAARIEEISKELNISQDNNKELSVQVEAHKNKANVLEAEIEELKAPQNLSSSAIVSTEVKQSVSEMQKQLNALSTDIENDVKTADGILSVKKDYEGEFFKKLKDKLENFEQLQNTYQTQYAQREATFRRTIDQRNSMAIYWNQGGIFLSNAVQGNKYLSLLDQNYDLMSSLNNDVKKLQTAYETLVKNEYRNEAEFGYQTTKVDEKITKPEERIEQAKAAYDLLGETKKNELLDADYKKLFTQLSEIRNLKSKLDETSEKKPSAIKSLFETIESEIKNSNSELPKNALEKFEVFRTAVESDLKQTLAKNAKFNHDIYANLRKWASPVWNETLNALKVLEVEIQLLKERALIHDIMNSFNAINNIKGLAQQKTAGINSLTTSYDNEKPALRAAHVKYYNLIDSYNETIASLTAKIADVKGEKALKQDLEEYSINAFTTKEIVTADLIKSLNKQLNLVCQQKAIIEETWKNLLQRVLDTSNDLLAVKNGGKISVGYLTGFDFMGNNPYVGIYTELSYRPAKQKTELLTQSANN